MAIRIGTSNRSRTYTSKGHRYLKPGRLPVPPYSHCLFPLCRAYHSAVNQRGIYRDMVGIEPTPHVPHGRCSTAELHTTALVTQWRNDRFLRSAGLDSHVSALRGLYPTSRRRRLRYGTRRLLRSPMLKLYAYAQSLAGTGSATPNTGWRYKSRCVQPFRGCRVSSCWSMISVQPITSTQLMYRNGYVASRASNRLKLAEVAGFEPARPCGRVRFQRSGISQAHPHFREWQG